MTKSRHATTTGPEAAAREQIPAITAELEAIRFRLLGAHASLSPEGPGAGMRAAIECILADAIEPALRDLRAAVDDPV
ncbi:MAG TPA: hypothetical protein VLQ45_02580 [Thermoanaerobaculia bacterium]|nr:hypothetical protein [Thermoanaerobaculia bacterium]